MDKTFYRTAAVSASLIFLGTMISAMALHVMRHSSSQGDKRLSPSVSKRQTVPTILEREVEELTNGISHAFSQAQTIPCASRTLKEIEAMTNASLRLVVARHLAKEVLSINLTNENYHLRWKNIDGAIKVAEYAYDCLAIADIPEMERCAFLFDTLQLFKECGMVTLGEPPTKPSEMDRYGRGMRWAQMNCKTSVRCVLRSAPGYLNNSEFRSVYPKLSPAGQEYFKKRFREVFGIEYVPDEPGRRAYLWGTKDTLWDGKGLEWRY